MDSNFNAAPKQTKTNLAHTALNPSSIGYIFLVRKVTLDRRIGCF